MTGKTIGATGATGAMTGKTVGVAGLDCSGNREPEDRIGHATYLGVLVKVMPPAAVLVLIRAPI